MIVQSFVEQNVVMGKNMSCNIKEKNLYKLLLKICEDKKILDKIPALEEKKGSDFIVKSLRGKSADAKNFVDEILKDDFCENDVLLITGVGAAFPFIRAHEVLNAMGVSDFGNIPIVVMYPGTFNGRDVKLFNELPKISYYRAFNIIGEEV